MKILLLCLPVILSFCCLLCRESQSVKKFPLEPSLAATIVASPEPSPTTTIVATQEPSPTTTIVASSKPSPAAAIVATQEPSPTTTIVVSPEPSPTTTIAAIPEPAPTPFNYSPEMKWLMNRMDANPAGKGFIWSWDLEWLAGHNPTSTEKEVLETWKSPRYGQSYCYDQALTALALMMHYRLYPGSISLEKIHLALDRLISIQQIDGHFAFWNIGTGEKGDSYNGASAWAGLAFTYYLRYIDMNTSRGYVYYAEKLADFLLYCQDPRTKLIAVNDIRDAYSTEHNIDAFFFFNDMKHLSTRLDYPAITGEIQSALMTFLWNESKGTFDRGYDDPEDALDCSSWGAIFLLAIGAPEKSAGALAHADQVFAHSSTNYPTIHGYHRGEELYRGDTVWSEGSLGVAMAFLKAGNTTNCDTILGEMEKIQQLDPAGGLLYNTDTYDGPEYVKDRMLRAPSAAGTAWLAIVKLMRESPDIMNSFWAGE